MLSRFAPFFAQCFRSLQRCLPARHRSFFFQLAAAMAASVVPVVGLTQAVPIIIVPSTTVFLADPQLGVVGAYQSGGNVLYFEARTPDRSTQLSVRLLDADGRTIAISGTSMDSEWNTTVYDAASAVQSLSLASALSSSLATALPGGIVFSREAAALSNLAVVASQATPGTAAVRADAVVASVPLISAAAATTASQYDATAASTLSFARDSLGNLNIAFGSTGLQSFVLNFPGELDEDTDAMGVVEASARLVAPDGTPIAHLLGGDYIPDAWYPNMFAATPVSALDPIQLSSEVGSAIRGAALLARFPSIATAQEADAFNTLALNLRDNALLPEPLAAAASGSLYSRVAIWWKPTLVIAQHSGTIVRHLQGVPGHLHQRSETIYCNHGTCPGNKKVIHFKCMYTTAGLASWRNVPHGIVPSGQQGAGELHSCYKTYYDVFSGFTSPLSNPGHNCHDDSWTQVRAIKGESFLLLGGPRCNEHTLYKTAPNCTD